MHQIAKELSKIQNEIEHSKLLELAVHDQNENISFFFLFLRIHVFELKCLKKQEVKLQKADTFTSMFTYIYLKKIS